MKDKDKSKYDKLKNEFIQKRKEFLDEYEPVYKGCENKECNCTGACKEIIRYRKKNKNLIEIN